MAFGTPIYMAPEQALGNPMDGRADLYAAAVIGYEMLCGQPPFYSRRQARGDVDAHGASRCRRCASG